jgi:hypothetical protein
MALPVSSSAAIPDRLRLRLDFDAVRLRRDLERVGNDLWIAHFVKQNYDGDWSVFPLRGPEGASHPVMMIYPDPTATRFADTPYLEALPYFREALGAFRCPIKTARLMKLGAGSIIKRHRDLDLSFAEGNVRVHIPVTTSETVEFRLNDQPVTMLPGECWYLRLSDPHEAANRSAVDRVHLVIDLEVNAWLQRLFDESLREAKTNLED